MKFLYRCHHCRTRRGSLAGLLAHQRRFAHFGPCWCPGLHFPHRPGSRSCLRDPYKEYHDAQRAGKTGAELLDAFIASALNGHPGHKKAGINDPCPF